MAIIPGVIKQRLQQIQSGNRFGFSNDLWRPNKDGEESKIRLVDYPYQTSGDPFVQLYFHYNIGGTTGILCPKMNFGKTCPICNFAKTLREGADGKGGTEEDKKSAKQLYPKDRYFAVVVDREDEVLTPKFWGFSPTLYEELLGYLVNPEYSKFLDAKDGIDLTVKTVKKPEDRFPKISIKFSRHDTPLADSQEQIDKIIQEIKKIDEVYKPITTAEINERLNSWLSGGDDLSTEDSDNSKNSETVKGNTSETESVTDIDKEFDKLL